LEHYWKEGTKGSKQGKGFVAKAELRSGARGVNGQHKII